MSRSVRLLSRLAALALAACLAPSARAQLGVNLVINPGAEAGPGSTDGGLVGSIPGWTSIGNFTVVQYGAAGGFPAATDPGPADRGANFFAGGRGNIQSYAAQLITLTSDTALIDTGGVSFTLSGYLGGFVFQGDNATLTATFENSGGAGLGTASIGPVSNTDRNNDTGLLFRSAGGTVPVGTRQIGLSLLMTRLSGDYNDGYADNLSLVLAGRPVPAPVPEPGVLPMLGAVCSGGLYWLKRLRRV